MTKKLKILIVDDNRDFCENIKDILEMKGYKADIANTGMEGFEMVKNDGYQLVLMDVKMPVMNGVETYKKIKKIKPDLPVIMITAYAVEKLIEDALKEGAFGALRKPVNFDELFDLIENATEEGTLILVADDDADLCSNLQDIISGKGYRVKTASDSEQAIHIAEKNNFDIILLDLKFPPLNGLETYLEIRKKRPNAVVVLITGYYKDMKDEINILLQKAAYTCIEKPIEMEELLLLIKKIEIQKNAGTFEKT